MARSWYVNVGTKTTGPFSTEQLLEDLKQKKIPADATVCASGLTRFHKISDEPELAAAFAPPTPPTVLPQVGATCATSAKCCPMPRIIAATSLILTGAFWATAAVAATGACASVPAKLSAPVGYGLAALVAVVSLAVASGIARRKGCATCGATKLHVAGLVGSLVLAKVFCPVLLVVSGVHVIGLLTARKAKKQICAEKTPPTLV